MVARVRARWFVGLGVLGVALVLGGVARSRPPAAAEEEAIRKALQEFQGRYGDRFPAQVGILPPGEELVRFWAQGFPGQEIITELGRGEPLTPETHGIGVAVEAVGAPMRAQLDLPAQQGVVVTEVAPDSPAAKAGLKPHDVLLKLGDEPVSEPEDLDRRFRDGGADPVVIRLLRGGQETTAEVTPRKQAEPRRYYIGVSVQPLSDALRSHLGLPADQGVVAGEVQPDSPADKAGIQANDILLSVDGKPVGDVEGIVAQIQEVQDKPVAVKVLRGGKPKTVEVTPEKLKEPLPGPPPERTRVLPRDFRLFGPGGVVGPDGVLRPGPVPLPRGLPGALGMPPRQLDRRLDELSDQIKELRKAVEALQKATEKE